MTHGNCIVAIVGVTGAVGQQILKYLEEREFPVSELRPLASARSAGQKILFRGEEIVIREAVPEAFAEVDIALFSAGGRISEQLVPEVVARGVVVIDNTNAFRMNRHVPLVVPEVNKHMIRQHQGIIANPNCATIQMVVALKPLYDRYGIKRVIVSTYQSVSGAGWQATCELQAQSHAVLQGGKVSTQIMPVAKLDKHYQMAFNVIPQIDVAQANGYTLEEMKMVQETKKILNDSHLGITATCVRVPVMRAHSESVYVELKANFVLDEVRALLANSPGIVVQDDIDQQIYPMPIDAANRWETFVGRIRRDLTHPRALNLWIVSDNLLKGAAINAIQIAETLVRE
jgi:aspartate-semialdehyde dehydrogenase